jgi:uncharacterized protein
MDKELLEGKTACDEGRSPGGSSSLSVLIEPTSACNLDCRYCYKGEKPNSTMSEATFETAAQKVISYARDNNRPLLFVWHGGEPTLAGPDFYRHAFRYCAEHCNGHKMAHTLQTNGTLLSDELLDLFVEYKISIGVSLDGPAVHHNSMRPSKNGESTHPRVVDGIMRARGKGVDVGVLMSITKGNTGHIKDMFKFCRENNLTFGLNPISADLHADHSNIEISPEEYLQACIEAYDHWFYQKDFSIQVNPGYGVTRLLLSKNRLSDCTMSENCQMHFISIGPEGDVYPCNRFYGVADYRLGNIVTDQLESIMAGEKRRYLLGRCSSKIEKCRDCSIAHYCNSGCMHHAVVHNGALYSPDHLCIVYKGLVEHAIKRLGDVLN